MLNRKVIDDWGTPKPATERHSFLQHLSGHTMRRGHSKFGTDIGKLNFHSKSSHIWRALLLGFVVIPLKNPT